MENLNTNSKPGSQTLLEIIPIPIWYVNKEGIITYRNKRFIEVFGYDDIDVPTLKDWWLKAYPDENYREWVINNWEAAVKSAAEKDSDIESEVYNVTCKNGSVRNIIISGTTINDDFLATFMDITQRKQAEEKLLISEERYSLASAASDNGIWDWLVEENKVYYSNQWKAQLGYKPNEIVNEFKSWEDLLHPNCKESMTQKIMGFLSNPSEFFRAEFRMKHKDGSYKWIHNKAAAVKDENGKVIRMFGAHTDITERKEAEEKVIEERNKAQHYLDVADVMLVSINPSGIVELINNKGCEILGYSEEEILEHNWYDNFLPERMRKDVKKVANSIYSQEIESIKYYENEILTKSGEEKLIAWHTAQIKDEKGNIISSISSGEDITDRKKAEEELKNHRENLETMVNERTKELEDKNKELDNALLVFVGREQTIRDLEDRVRALGGR